MPLPTRSLALAALLALLAAPAAHAQAIDPAKQKLIDELLAVFHPEAPVIASAQMPAARAMEQSKIALETSRVPKDRADKALADIGKDVQKYVDAVTPITTASATKNAGAGDALIAQNFSVDELRELVAIYKSDARKRFEKLSPQVSTAIGKRVEADVGPQVNQNVKALQESVGLKLRAAATAN